MQQKAEQDLKDFTKASAKLKREIGGDRDKALAYLVKIGILEKHRPSKHGVRLVKDLHFAE